ACGSIGPRGCPQQIYSISARILASARKSHWPNKPKSHRQPDEPAETLSNKLIFPSLQRYHLCVSSSTLIWGCLLNVGQGQSADRHLLPCELAPAGRFCLRNTTLIS